MQNKMNSFIFYAEVQPIFAFSALEDILSDRGKVIDILDAFKEIKRIIVQDEMAFKIKNGVAIRGLFKEEMAFILDNEKRLLALYKNNEGICRAYKMFL